MGDQIEAASLRAKRSNPVSKLTGLLRRFAPRNDKRGWLAAALLVPPALASPPARAADTLHVGKAINVLWIYTVLDIGVQQGIFAKDGLDVEISVLPGDAKFQQALIAKSIDIGLASGTSMALSAKGSPAVAVAAYAGAPRNFSVNVAADSDIHSVADLKGRLLATATAGSLPEWLIKRLSLHEGWGVDGIRTTATGGFEASLAATLTHSVDGFMGATEAGLQLEEEKRGRIVTNMEQYVPRFITQVVSTRTDFVAAHPELVERFLKGLFASVAYVKQHKAESTAIARQVLHQSPAVMDRTYDSELSMLSDDGSFDPEAITVLKDSYVEMGILPDKPPDDKLFTTRFVPVKP
jgi:ABC-type nitrate/sulfonate/bicarbonate transport system substrate-binding protein